MSNHVRLIQPAIQSLQHSASSKWIPLRPRRSWKALPTGSRRGILTLAIETSADDTCVAVLEKTDARPGIGAAKLHFNKKLTADNRSWKGIHPMATVENHTRVLGALVEEALWHLPAPSSERDSSAAIHLRDHSQSGNNTCAVPKAKPDFVSVTRGPGMTSNLSTGLNTAKGLAVAWGVPLLGVHHMQAHALTPRLVSALRRWDDEEKKGIAMSSDTVQQQHRQDQSRPYEPSFPFLSLLVSGGHTLLLRSSSATRHELLAAADNIALGDYLDKCARFVVPPDILGARGDVMYGRALEEYAFPSLSVPRASSTLSGQDTEYTYTPPPPIGAPEREVYVSPSGAWTLSPPLREVSRRDGARRFDFSGLLSEVQRAAQRIAASAADGLPLPSSGDRDHMTAARGTAPPDDADRRLLAREAMRVAFEHVSSRLFMTADPAAPPPPTLVVSGGVAANGLLRRVLRATMDARGWGNVALAVPPAELCTDNAAMIGWAGIEMWELGWRSSIDILARRKWPLDGNGIGSGTGEGILEMDGWVRRE